MRKIIQQFYTLYTTPSFLRKTAFLTKFRRFFGKKPLQVEKSIILAEFHVEISIKRRRILRRLHLRSPRLRGNDRVRAAWEISAFPSAETPYRTARMLRGFKDRAPKRKGNSHIMRVKGSLSPSPYLFLFFSFIICGFNLDDGGNFSHIGPLFKGSFKSSSGSCNSFCF